VHQEREGLREPDEGIADQPERVQQDGKGEADKRCLAGDREVEPAGVVAKIDGHPAVRHASGPEIVHDRPKRPKSQHFKEGGSQLRRHRKALCRSGGRGMGTIVVGRAEGREGSFGLPQDRRAQ
jgi:hypothetical protein